MMSEAEVREAYIAWSAALAVAEQNPDEWTEREIARAQGYVDCLSMVLGGTE